MGPGTGVALWIPISKLHSSDSNIRSECTAKAITHRMTNIRKKASELSIAPDTIATPKRRAVGKRAKATGGGDMDSEGTPSKKAKRTSENSTREVKNEAEEDDGQEGSNVLA